MSTDIKSIRSYEGLSNTGKPMRIDFFLYHDFACVLVNGQTGILQDYNLQKVMYVADLNEHSGPVKSYDLVSWYRLRNWRRIV